jgi:L-lactate dehydrogenase (cytochrome)
MKAASISDYRELARLQLPLFLFEYLDGGSYSEVTLRRNITDLERVALRQRVLRDVSGVDTSTTLFGERLSMPVILAPIGLAGMNARRGECQAMRAANRAGVPFCLSTVSVCSLAEVARAATSPSWFQLYMIRDRAFMIALLAEAESLGCPALLFTVDMPVPGSRYRDYRSGLVGAPGWAGNLRRFRQALSRPRWAWEVGIHGRPHVLGNVAPVLQGQSGIEDFFAWMRQNFDPKVTWNDIEWVRSHWKRPLILKGILDPSDAREAARLGVDGIVVSNHGGRQLDGVLSSARALPSVADAVGDQLTVLADGGIRSGLDVVRMLSLGAKGVLIGRAWVYALAACGERGVSHVLDLLSAEMKVAMALTGCTRIEALGRETLANEGQGTPTISAADLKEERGVA